MFAISTFAYSAFPDADSWSHLSDDFIDQYLAFSPTASTQVGIHIHDAELDDYSPASIAKQIAWLQQFEKRVLAFDRKTLSATDAADREILLNNIRANLLELQVIRTFAKNPDNYSSGAAASIYVIMRLRNSFRLRGACSAEGLGKTGCGAAGCAGSAQQDAATLHQGHAAAALTRGRRVYAGHDHASRASH